MTLSADGVSWNFSDGWGSDVNNGYFTYIPYNDFAAAIKGVNGNNLINLVSMNPNVSVTNSNGVNIKDMPNAIKVSSAPSTTIPYVQSVIDPSFSNTPTQSVLPLRYNLPNDVYTINNISGQNNQITVYSNNSLIVVDPGNAVSSMTFGVTDGLFVSTNPTGVNDYKIEVRSENTMPITILGSGTGSVTAKQNQTGLVLSGQAQITVEQGDNSQTVNLANGEYQVSPIMQNNSVAPAQANSEITVYVNGKKIAFDQKPIISNSRTLVPIRFISEELGATVSWDAQENKVGIIKGSDSIMLYANKTQATINGNVIELDTSPIILNGRTLVPIRFIAEAFNATVDWDASTYSVIITTN